MKKKEEQQKDASLQIDGCLDRPAAGLRGPDRRCGSAWMALACSPTSLTSWPG
jgi:hypothetical protein